LEENKNTTKGQKHLFCKYSDLQKHYPDIEEYLKIIRSLNPNIEFNIEDDNIYIIFFD